MLYEIGAEGMKPITVEGKNNLPIGTVLHLNGYNALDYVIVKNLGINSTISDYGTRYLKVSLEDYGQYQCNAFELKFLAEKQDNSIQLYITDKVLSAEAILDIWEKSEITRKDKEEKQRKAEENRKILIEKGKELFNKYIPADVKALIIAEKHKNESDIQTDYFSHAVTDTVILGFSRHTRDDFREMRKYADKIPETKHLGQGHFEPRVIIGEDFQQAQYYYKGSYSHWHRELTEKEGYQLVFSTKQAAEEYITKAGLPESITFDGKLIAFEWKIEEEKLEHREKWSMGAGYYLKDGGRDETGWAIEKVKKYREDWSEEYYIAIAKRCIFQ